MNGQFWSIKGIYLLFVWMSFLCCFMVGFEGIGDLLKMLKRIK